MSGLRPDTHVAQQSRRDKLRIQSDLFQVRDACDQAMFSSPASAAEFAAGCQVPLIAPSSSMILGESAGALHPQPGCEWVPSPALVPYNHLYHHQPKPGFAGYHVDASTDLHFVSHPPVTSQGRELQSVITQPQGPWSVDSGGSEMLFLPGYAGDPPATVLMARQIPREWSEQGKLMSSKCDDAAATSAGGNEPRTARGLSLTLASSLVPELGMASQLEAGPSCAYPKFIVGDRSFSGGGSLQDIVTSPGDAAARRGSAGPLGPFTGYATILRNSRFLRPAQQLLDEFCSVVTGSKLSKRCCVGEASRGASSSSHDVVSSEKESSSRGGNSGGASTSSLYSSAEAGGNVGRASGSNNGTSKIQRPEFQQKKAKLLHMQEEVCRRYKQYHQQMQMVVSSFESVAGLNSATPYSSLALKAISKHFRSLKNAISDQIRHISKVLGEELMSSPSSGKGESITTPRLKYLDQSLRKQKAGEGTLSFMENNQPVWRPQRGLPERAVSVLRSWLFEHFLHPYPTDTDKHMLATQTGLSRNQVSNWFINARVRLWKPMIEEIHMLETKGMSGMDLNSANVRDARPAGDEGAPSTNDQRLQPQCSELLDCPPLEPVFNGESSQNLEAWQGDKRSRVEECEMLTSMDASLMNFATYQHTMDIGGIEAVSLTLGLRHEGGQQNQPQMRHFGTQMFHDFVG